MKSTNKAIILSLLLVCLFCASVILSSADSDPTHGSHGFYGHADSSVVDGKAFGMMLDFLSDSETGICTYYSTMNFSLSTTATLARMREEGIRYSNFTGGGAYAGFQMVDAPDQLLV